MLALAFSFSLFLLWAAVGRALFAMLAPRFGALRAWLLAPGLGLAAFLLALMVLNQLGIPIGRCSRAMTFALFAAAVVVLVWRRPVTPARTLVPFAAAAIFSLCWTGWPALATGFNWISYANDDMANYCLAAERFADHGFFDVPTMAELAGRDYSAYYFFMHVADMMRFGAEHLVAWAATLGGLEATQAFMPAIVALSLAQLFAAAGLALQFGRHRWRALAAAWLVAVSPLFMLGTLYQLIAQVAGVTLTLVTLALLTHRWRDTRRTHVIRHTLLPALPAAALCICYPECSPFLGLAFIAYLTVALGRRRLTPATALAFVAYTLVWIIVLLRYNVISYVSITVMQLSSAMHEANLLLSLFPYFLLPTGFSNLFGWMPIAKDFAEPAVTLSIAAGMVLALALVVRAVREAWQLRAAALLLLVQAAVAVQLYRGGTDFPLYKLAMWMQPSLAIAIAGLVVALRGNRARIAVIALFAVSTAPTALHYTRAAEGLVSGGMTELRYASQLGLHIAPPAKADAQITATVENVVAAKFAASGLRGHDLALASRDYFFPNTRIDFRDPPPHVLFHPHYDQMAQARPLMLERNRTLITTSMLWRTEFTQPVLAHGTDDYLALTNQLSLFNKFGHDAAAPVRAVFEMRPAAALRNELVFVHSGLGNHYYLGDRRRISFFQQEADPFMPGRDFNGLGRFMLLRIEHPTDEIYLRIAATRTLLPGRTAWKPLALDARGQPLPPVDAAGNPTCPLAHGTTDLPLGIVGHGAFNLIVGPLRPHEFQGAHYVAIDFAEVTQQILDRRAGLKAIYNRFVPLDYRRLIGWARDISALSPEQYRQLRRPLRVANFPADLATAETLEFSGIYEDGWLSPESKFVLGAPAGDSRGEGGCVHLRGFVPELAGTPLGGGTLQLTVDGRTIDVPAATGAFDWLVPLTNSNAATRVGLHFTASATLPNHDARPAAAKLELLEVLPALPLRAFDYATPGTPRLPARGIDQDGWMRREAAIELPPAASAAQLVLKIELPDWGTRSPAPLRAKLDGDATVIEQTLEPGQYATVRVPLSTSASPRTLRLEVGADFPLAPPDTRRRACRLLRVELAPNA